MIWHKFSTTFAPDLLLKTTIASAKKVLLCGKVRNSPFLTIHAGELILKDFDYQVAAIGGVSIKAGLLMLEGANKITTVAIPVGSVSLTPESIVLNVENGVQGKGTLEVDSKVVTCAQIKESAAKDKREKEKQKEEKAKVQNAEPKK